MKYYFDFFLLLVFYQNLELCFYSKNLDGYIILEYFVFANKLFKKTNSQL